MISGSERETRGGIDEAQVMTTKENMVIFKPHRPARAEPDLNSSSDCCTPARVIVCRRGSQTSSGGNKVIPLVHNSCTTLRVQQHVVPCPADLACEETEGVDFRAQLVCGVAEILSGAADVGPVTLSFQSKYPAGRLPTVSNLTAGNCTAWVKAAQVKNIRHVVAALVRPSAAAIGADIEA